MRNGKKKKLVDEFIGTQNGAIHKFVLKKSTVENPEALAVHSVEEQQSDENLVE